jgi:glycerol-3-phosphate dehydrogenase
MSDTNSAITDVDVDVLIIGGGIAGLWSLARLQQAGYKTVLLESEALGAGQTRYAQGIIHGGTKYALTGKLTASSESVADMPARWRACYEGSGELDLSQAELISDAHYLWSTTSLTSRISGFFASKVMRSRSAEVGHDALPSIFQHSDFKGQFYRLDEPVFNTLSVIRALAEPRKQSILMIDPQSVTAETDAVRVTSQDGDEYVLRYKKLVLMAGQGNEELLSKFGCSEPAMQRRPLRMVVMRGSDDNALSDMIYAHCLGASVNPRVTITSHRDDQGNIVWYMGGQLAEEGVGKSDVELISRAKSELAELIPWLSLKDKQWGVLDIDRAEIKIKGSSRPDTFSIVEDGNIITAWPTKLALAPALADDLVEMLNGKIVAGIAEPALPGEVQLVYAGFPWDTIDCWVEETGTDKNRTDINRSKN